MPFFVFLLAIEGFYYKWKLLFSVLMVILLLIFSFLADFTTCLTTGDKKFFRKKTCIHSNGRTKIVIHDINTLCSEKIALI